MNRKLPRVESGALAACVLGLISLVSPTDAKAESKAKPKAPPTFGEWTADVERPSTAHSAKGFATRKTPSPQNSTGQMKRK